MNKVNQGLGCFNVLLLGDAVIPIICIRWWLVGSLLCTCKPNVSTIRRYEQQYTLEEFLFEIGLREVETPVTTHQPEYLTVKQ